jgi:hypothetical protein
MALETWGWNVPPATNSTLPRRRRSRGSHDWKRSWVVIEVLSVFAGIMLTTLTCLEMLTLSTYIWFQ